jgi:hypothetical protein
MYESSNAMMSPIWKGPDVLEQFRDVPYTKWWRTLEGDALMHSTPLMSASSVTSTGTTSTKS